MLPTKYRYMDSGGTLKTKRIIGRDAVAMVGELELTPGFPNTFVDFPTNGSNPYLNTAEQPVEVHEMIPVACLVDGTDNPLAEPPPGINFWWRLQITLTQRNNMAVLRGNQRVAALLDKSTGIWHVSGPDMDSPYYFPNQCGWVVSAASLVPATGSNLIANISLKGYVLSLGEEVRDEGDMPLRQDRGAFPDVPRWPTHDPIAAGARVGRR